LWATNNNIKGGKVMAEIHVPVSFEKEEELFIPIVGGDCIALSGYANFFSGNTEEGGPSSTSLKGYSHTDTVWNSHEVHMVVGPMWVNVRDVSPIVVVAGYTFHDSDEADDSGYQVDNCTWDTVGQSGGPTDFERNTRIRLKVNIKMRGGSDFSVTKLAYHLIAVGRMQ
jgi:hypothetical protein